MPPMTSVAPMPPAATESGMSTGQPLQPGIGERHQPHDDEALPDSASSSASPKNWMQMTAVSSQAARACCAVAANTRQERRP